MRRRIAAILLLLIGGAVVNVAVAASCILLSGSPRSHWVEGLVGRSGTPRAIPQFLARLHGSDDAMTRGGSFSFGFDELYLWEVDRTTWAVVVGWPLRAFCGSVQSWEGRPPPNHRQEAGILWELSGRIGRWVPVGPIWPGLIINTLFYALFIWLLFVAPFAARRMLRRRRGQCEKCAYPISVSEVCTECGAAVRPVPSRNEVLQ